MIGHPEEEFASELISGEKLLWSGRPQGGFLFRAADRVQIPIGVFFFAMGIATAVSMSTDGGLLEQPFPFMFFPSSLSLSAAMRLLGICSTSAC
jgi:hypothetical protein